MRLEKPKEFTPTIKIVEVFAHETDLSGLQKMIIESNPALKLDDTNFKVTQIYSNGVQKGSRNAIAEISIEKFKIVMSIGSILVNTKNCKTYEHLELLHCNKCQKYGHVKKFCASKEFICGNCSENHQTIDCANRDKWKCVNCANLNDPKVKTNHYTNSPACQVRKDRISGIKKFLKQKLLILEAAIGDYSPGKSKE